jgi:hypothetical protein
LQGPVPAVIIAARFISLQAPKETPMSDADTRALIENLQRSNRLWKRLALGLLVALGLAIVLLAVSATVLSISVVQQQRRAREAEVEARMQAEKALRQEQEAKKRFEDARKAVDEFQRKGQQP